MILIKNGHVKTMTGPDIERGQVLIGDDGKIAAVGAKVKAPAGAQIIDAGGRLVTPGCVEAHCHTGIKGEAGRWEVIDHNEISDPVVPQMRAIDGIRPQDEDFALAVQNGVTSACVCPGSANVVGGTCAAIKLVGECVDDMVIKNPVAMKCAFGENPKDFHGQSGKKAPFTRMGVAAMLRELLFKTQRYIEKKESGKEPEFDMKLEAMIPVLKKEIPLKAHAHRADDVLTSIRIAREFDVGLTLDHCTDGATVADSLAKAGYPALVGPSFGPKNKVELKSKSFETAGALYRAGVPVSIVTDSPVIPLKHLPLCAGLAVAGGLPLEEGWRAVTINPAHHVGIADRVGSLEVGKDADIVIWTADPLIYIGGTSYITIIDGKIVWQKDA